MTEQTIPVTVLTGFLGSGKTTLLNHILHDNHGKRIAVIENEFGETGIDHELVINADEEIFEMNNGCICCTVRGDLIRILSNLIKRRNAFDYILIETTGLADPGPVAQTFFVDPELSTSLRLDGIVTLVDAKHVAQHLDDSTEAQEQVAFADVILLNKTDIVDDRELETIEKRVRSMNSNANVHRTKNAAIDLGLVLDLGGFDLDRALEIDPKFMEPEYPFEWAGIYDLQAGSYALRTAAGPDPSMKALLLPLPEGHIDDESLRRTELLFGDEIFAGAWQPGRLCSLDVSSAHASHEVELERSGSYALFLEHHPDEFGAQLLHGESSLDPDAAFEYKPDHDHDDTVSSVSITTPGDLDPDRLNRWIGELLQTKGEDIFRMKGVLSLQGCDRRIVFQGVHMLFDSKEGETWESDAARRNALIFIGRNLNLAELNESFKACLI